MHRYMWPRPDQFHQLVGLDKLHTWLKGDAAMPDCSLPHRLAELSSCCRGASCCGPVDKHRCAHSGESCINTNSCWRHVSLVCFMQHAPGSAMTSQAFHKRNAEPRFGASEQLTKVALPAAEPRRPCCCALCAAAGALCCGSWRRRCGQLPLPTAAPAAVAVESGMSRKSLHTKCATRQRRAMACDCTTTASKGGCRGVPALQRICSHGMARSMLGHTLHSRIAAHKQYIAPQR